MDQPLRNHLWLIAAFGFVMMLCGGAGALYLNGNQLNRAYDENAALQQKLSDVRVAYGLPEDDSTPAPLFTRVR